jgi:hypothetical protein
MPLAALADWDNFYVITGSAAAGLTGLTFVVISLTSEARRVNAEGLRAYVTPTIVHFAAVLALAAFMTVPHRNLGSLATGVGLGGLAGVAYVAATAARMRRVAGSYRAVGEDWLWHVILPALAYGLLLAFALLGARHLGEGLPAIAVAALALLFVGIHNCWDVAVWHSVHRAPDATPPP